MMPEHSLRPQYDQTVLMEYLLATQIQTAAFAEQERVHLKCTSRGLWNRMKTTKVVRMSWKTKVQYFILREVSIYAAQRIPFHFRSVREAEQC